MRSPHSPHRSSRTDRRRALARAAAFPSWLAALPFALAALALGASTPASTAEVDTPAASADTAASALAPRSGDASRRFELVYRVTLPPNAFTRTADGAAHLFLPLPREDARQRVLDLVIDAPFPGQVDVEPVYGNRYWHAALPAEGPDGPLEVVLRARIERRHHTGLADGPLPADLRERFLGPNARVPVDHPMLDPIRAEIRSAAPEADPTARARAIYDWVVDNVEYKKIGTGWGNGDTFWACTERYGNCTDFHALFVSLARGESIPARFEIGFPVPLERPTGRIAGYHCWVDVHLPDAGWIPIDASEASKDPSRRALFFGTQPADRVHFTTGRDLRLGPNHRGRPLNYFVHPYLEIEGQAAATPPSLEVTYREVDEAGATAISRRAKPDDDASAPSAASRPRP